MNAIHGGKARSDRIDADKIATPQPKVCPSPT